jgi:hypothetical protein
MEHTNMVEFIGMEESKPIFQAMWGLTSVHP